MENDKWKMENEQGVVILRHAIFHFPFSISQSSSGAQHRPLNKLLSFLTSRPLLVVVTIATTVSVLSFLYFFSNGMTNVYGDRRCAREHCA